jgi:predicted O-methyltransferase YrrM
MRILEIGSGRGDRTVALAAAMPPGGMLIGMEADATRAATARERLKAAGHDNRVSIIVGEPIRFLHKVRGPFELIVLNVDVPRDRLDRLLAAGGVVVENHATITDTNMTIAEWLAQAKADAEKRGLPELVPMLDGLAQATERLRAADWNDTPDIDPSTASADATHPPTSLRAGTSNDDDQ